MDGEVAGRPWPGWVAQESRAVSVARLLRRLDDVLVEFGLPDDLVEEPAPAGAPDPVGPAPFFLGHRDVTPENTVFRDGQAHALIDFDLLQPSTRIDEVASLLLWWAGWMPPEDRDPALHGVDPAVRGRVLVDAYGHDDDERGWVVPVCISNAERAWFLMRERADRLGGGWLRMWQDGVGGTIKRREQWLLTNQGQLGHALTD